MKHSAMELMRGTPAGQRKLAIKLVLPRTTMPLVSGIKNKFVTKPKV